jgi:hypothetical protein
MDVTVAAVVEGECVLVIRRRTPERGRSHGSQHGSHSCERLAQTLGCLLAAELGIQLRRVGSGNRLTFADGEQELSQWMAENAYVSWIACGSPWELEDHLIASLDLPLNLQGNGHNPFHPVLTGVRAKCTAEAKALPVLPNPGRAGPKRPATHLLACKPRQEP